jgi:hypothetical protein
MSENTDGKTNGSIPKPGDVIWVDRGLYQHCGIYEGGGWVIHFAAPAGSEVNQENAVVHRIRLEDFQRGDTLKVVKFEEGYPPEETLRRAYERIGERGYDFLTNNCDHFATWCKTGEHRSLQVEAAEDAIKAAAGALSGEFASVLAEGICAFHDIAQEFKVPTLETEPEHRKVGDTLAEANALVSATSESYIPPQDEAAEAIAKEVPPDEAEPDDAYPELPHYPGDESEGNEESKNEYAGDEGDDGEGRTPEKKQTFVDKVAETAKTVVYAVSGALEMFKPRLPGPLKNIPFKAIGAKVANVLDKVVCAVKTALGLITPQEAHAEMRNADTALLGQTVREKSPVSVGERVKTVFGKVGAAVKQVAQGFVSKFLPQPVRTAIATGFKKVGTAIVNGVKQVGGFFAKIGQKARSFLFG